MAPYRLARPAAEEIVRILERSEALFGLSARERYSALPQRAIEDLAEDPSRPGARAVTVLRRPLIVYHIEHSRNRVPDPPGRVRDSVHPLVASHGKDSVLDILGIMHECMLRTRALRRMAPPSGRADRLTLHGPAHRDGLAQPSGRCQRLPRLQQLPVRVHVVHPQAMRPMLERPQARS